MTVTIGVTGPMRAGKTTTAELLSPRGYVKISLSVWLRQEAERRGLDSNDRIVLMDLGDNERRKFGGNILAERVAEHIIELRKKGGAEKVIIDGLKNPAEIRWLKENFGMTTFGITADDEIRLNRALDAEGLDYQLNPEAVRKRMERDLGIGQEDYGQQLEACMKEADVIIENNGTVSQFEKRLLTELARLEIEENH